MHVSADIFKIDFQIWKDVIKSETANILTTEHKVVLLSEFDLEDIFYVDDDGNIKDR